MRKVIYVLSERNGLCQIGRTVYEIPTGKKWKTNFVGMAQYPRREKNVRPDMEHAICRDVIEELITDKAVLAEGDFRRLWGQFKGRINGNEKGDKGRDGFPTGC